MTNAIRYATIGVVALLAVVLIALRAGWLGGSAEPPPPAIPPLLLAIDAGDAATAVAALAAGADANERDVAGNSALHLAALRDLPDAAAALIAAGADVNAVAADGTTPLLVSLKGAQGLGVPLMLLQAGADPTLRDAAGMGVLEAVDGNRALRSGTFVARLRELAERPFARGWPSLYVSPVPNATISSRAAHWPNAPRAYRNGIHEGFDFYAGATSGSASIAYGTPLVAVADGVVIRSDQGYLEMTAAEYDAVITTARSALVTPPDALDRLRGMQVWIEHPGGFVSRYAHLASIPESVVVGGRVIQGAVIGTTGNSGTLEAAQGTQDDPHPHVEIWRGDTYLGEGLDPEEIFALAGQLFGAAALPPRWGP